MIGVDSDQIDNYHGAGTCIFCLVSPPRFLLNESVQNVKICRCMAYLLIPFPSYTADPPGQSGAGIAESAESWRHAGAEAELHPELALILVVFW